MMLVLCVVVAVGLLSLGEAAPLTNTCQDMLTPLQLTGPDLFLGKWMLVGMSQERLESTNRAINTTFVDAGWLEVTQGSSNTTQDILYVHKRGDVCYSVRYNRSFDKNTFTMEEPYQSTQNLYRTTCPDCLLIRDSTTVFGETFVSLQILSKRRELSADELDTFKQQAKCLTFNPPTILDPKMGQLGDFLGEMDGLLSSFPDDGTPLVLLDLEKCQNSTLRQDITDGWREDRKEVGKGVKEFIDKLQAMNTQQFIAFLWDDKKLPGNTELYVS